MTKENATQIIKDYKDDTAYFDGSMTALEMQEMLRTRFGFGLAESLVITAALVKAGAKPEMTKANEIAKYGEPYCPNYRCSDCGQTRPCKRRIDWNVVKRTHPFFTRFTDSFPCSDFFPSAIHVLT